jgi:large subunit ribosomal protein L15
MAISLHTIKPAKGSRKTAKRVGRGLSKGGSYSGRGVKGQRARSGGRSGLQKKGLRHIMLSLKKNRGFNSLYGKYCVVNLNVLAREFPDGAKITPKVLFEKGLISSVGKVKLLGNGAISIKINVVDCAVSASARIKIEKVGGTVL